MPGPMRRQCYMALAAGHILLRAFAITAIAAPLVILTAIIVGVLD